MPIEDFFVPISSGRDRRTTSAGPTQSGSGREPQPSHLQPPKSFAQTLRDYQRAPSANRPARTESSASSAKDDTTQNSQSSTPTGEKRVGPSKAKLAQSDGQSKQSEPSTGQTDAPSRSTRRDAAHKAAESSPSEAASLRNTAPSEQSTPSVATTTAARTELESPQDAPAPPALAFLQEWLLPLDRADVTETPTDVESGELLTPPVGFLETLEPPTSVLGQPLANAVTTTSGLDEFQLEGDLPPDAVIPQEILESIVETVPVEATDPPTDLPPAAETTKDSVTFEPSAFETDGAATRALTAAVSVVPGDSPTGENAIVVDGWTAQGDNAESDAGTPSGELAATESSASEPEGGRPLIPPTLDSAVSVANPEHVPAKSTAVDSAPETSLNIARESVLQNASQTADASEADATATESEFQKHSQDSKPQAAPGDPAPPVQPESESLTSLPVSLEDRDLASRRESHSSPPVEGASQDAERAAPNNALAIEGQRPPAAAASAVSSAADEEQSQDASRTTDAGENRQQPSSSIAPAQPGDREPRSSSSRHPATESEVGQGRPAAPTGTLNSPNEPTSVRVPESTARPTDAAGTTRIPVEAAADERLAAASPSSSNDASDEGGVVGTARTSTHAARSERTAPVPLTTVPTETSAEQLLDRAAAAIRQSHDQNRQLRIRLHPPELGALQVDVSVRDGAVSARLEVQTASAHQTLVEHLGQLREALGQTGTTIERIDVQLVDASREDGRPDGQQRQGGQSSEREGRQGGHRHQRQQSTGDESAQADDHAPLPEAEADQLNIQV